MTWEADACERDLGKEKALQQVSVTMKADQPLEQHNPVDIMILEVSVGKREAILRL